MIFEWCMESIIFCKLILSNTNNEFKIDNQNDLMGNICINVIADNKLRPSKEYKELNQQSKCNKYEAQLH